MNLFSLFGSLFARRARPAEHEPCRLTCLVGGCARPRGTFVPLCGAHWNILHWSTRKWVARVTRNNPGSPAHRAAVEAAVHEAKLRSDLAAAGDFNFPIPNHVSPR